MRFFISIAVVLSLAFAIAGCSSDELAPDPVPVPVDASPDHHGDVDVGDAGRRDAEE